MSDTPGSNNGERKRRKNMMPALIVLMDPLNKVEEKEKFMSSQFRYVGPRSLFSFLLDLFYSIFLASLSGCLPYIKTLNAFTFLQLCLASNKPSPFP